MKQQCDMRLLIIQFKLYKTKFGPHRKHCLSMAKSNWIVLQNYKIAMGSVS
jgi:hypothetical protein